MGVRDVSSTDAYTSGFHINSIIFHILLQFNKYLSSFIYIGGEGTRGVVNKREPLTMVAITLTETARRMC